MVLTNLFSALIDALDSVGVDKGGAFVHVNHTILSHVDLVAEVERFDVVADILRQRGPVSNE